MRSRSSGGMPSPSSTICSDDGCPDRASCGCDRRAGGAYLAALSRRLNSACSNSTASSFEHRQVGREIELRRGDGRRILPARRKRRADDLAEIVRREIRRDRAGFELGHVEQIGDEAVEPLGFVDDRRQQVRLLAVGQLVAEVAQRAGRAENRGERRLEVMGDRGQQRRAQAVGLGGALDAVHVLDQVNALDGERALVDQRVEQAALVGREQRARLVAVDADDADGAAAGVHRQEQPLGARQRIGAAAGGAVVLPGPFGRGEIGIVERVLRRIAGLHRDRAVPGSSSTTRTLSIRAV